MGPQPPPPVASIRPPKMLRNMRNGMSAAGKRAGGDCSRAGKQTHSGGKYHPWTPDKPAGRGDAWGIAQWDPGVAALYWQQQAGVQGDITSLGVQLEIVWWQLQNKAPTSRPDVLKEMINYKELGGEYKDMDEISGATS